MANKTPRLTPYVIPPRTRTRRAQDWLGDHEYAGKAVLLLLLVALPLIGLWHGLQDAWKAWRIDWDSYR